MGEEMEPKYKRLKNIIKEDINSGKYERGTKIPSEKTLMEIYNLSRDTVRKTLNLLVQEKILYKVQGSGTYVANEVFNQTLLKFYSFTDEMKKLGKTPTSKIISFDEVENRGEELELFENLNKVYRLIRLRLADNKPVMYEITYLNPTLLKELSLEKLKEKPLYEIIRKDYKLVFKKAIEKYKAVIPNKEILANLEMKESKACMELNRLVYSKGELLEYTKSFARGDKLTFEIELK
jgi:GntR family transcriptional regulator